MTAWVRAGGAGLARDIDEDDGRPAVLYLHADVADRRRLRGFLADPGR